MTTFEALTREKVCLESATSLDGVNQRHLEALLETSSRHSGEVGLQRQHAKMYAIWTHHYVKLRNTTCRAVGSAHW